MSNKKSKRVYSKPKQVEKPVEEKIEEQVEEITEVQPMVIDPAVFETKLFVEEEPEEFVEITGEEEIVEEPEEIKIEQHIEGEKLADVLEANHNIDAVAELEKVLEAAQADVELVESTEETIIIAEDEVKEELQNLEFSAEESIQISETSESESMYTLTEEQEEEGAKAIADMVNNSILKELKALAPEPPKMKSLASLSNAELRHFRRTGQMPK